MAITLNQFFSRSIFGARNSHALKWVFLWRLWAIYTKWKYPGGAQDVSDDRIREMSDLGVTVIGHSDVDRLAALAYELLSQEPITDGYCGLPRAKNPSVAPLIYAILEEHKAKIEGIFGSFFRVNWFEVQKIVEGYDERQGPGSSFAYHTDDVPTDVMKVFIYLTDVTEESGAFRTFDYGITDQLISEGMLRSAAPGQPRADCQKLVGKELEDKLIIVEGKKGTVFIFDNNLIHKGTLPRKGMRIHVSMELMPSAVPLSYAEFSKDCDQPIREYFPLNPFRLRFAP